MSKNDVNSRIVCIPDTHFPFHRRGLFKELKAFVKDYQPTRVIHMGDICDFHRSGRWDPEADAMGFTEEIDASIDLMSQLADMFPKMDLMIGNHDLRPFKTMNREGIPSRFYRSFHESLELPETWTVHQRLVINGVQYLHGDGVCGQNGAMKMAQKSRMKTVIGHVHGWASVTYSQTNDDLIWAMNCGALIDETAIAFAYAKTKIDRSVAGVGTVTDGIPQFNPFDI